MRLLFLLAAALLVLAAAGCSRSDSGESDMLNTRVVTLPDGFQIKAEVLVTEAEMMRGMMYRAELFAGHGMLFVHGRPGHYPYWMANCKIPLDIIWMDAGHSVVEVSPDTPPCPSGGKDCPQYGGHSVASFALELGAGEARRHQVAIGSTLQF
jgi:uncharacterized membrane protein (UPF0127 family)